jgi:hypothetical protein
MTESILRALSMAFAMGWEILWPLILGFALSCHRGRRRRENAPRQ